MEPLQQNGDGLAEGGPLKTQEQEQEQEPQRFAPVDISQAPIKNPEAAPVFFGASEYKPNVVLKQEKPHHRQICILFAQGLTSTEIAEKTGYTTYTINDVRKQPWAQHYIAELMERQGRKAVMSELQGATLEAAQIMIKAMKGEIPGTKPCDQIKAAKELLDRTYGTAPANPPMDKVDLADLTDQELAATVRGQNN